MPTADPSIVATRASPRLLLYLGAVLCALLPAAVLLAVVLYSTARSADARAPERALLARAATVADSIAARLDAADRVARTLLSSGAALSDRELQSEAQRTGMFRDVLMTRETSVPGLPMAQLVSADGSRGELISLSTRRDIVTIYLVRRAEPERAARLAYFEIDASWLWPRNLGEHSDALVLDARGAMLRAPAQLPAHLAGMASAIVGGAETAARGAPRAALSWHADKQIWVGAVRELSLPPGLATANRWQVLAFAAPATASRTPFEIWGAFVLFGAVLLALAVARLGAKRLSALQRLAVVRVDHLGQRVVPRDAGELQSLPQLDFALARADERITATIDALEAFAEIDHLLLTVTELEPALDVILARVVRLIGCDAVGITLLEKDGSELGRVFVATIAGQSLPVTRVELDNEMLSLLRGSPEPITVARTEQPRHSFLTPLSAQGSQFFWVWPVTSASGLAGILALGFRADPALDPVCARHGAQFAARMSAALSKTARDERLYRQAHFDPLTALPNRLLFRDRLAQELGRAAETNSRGALLYVDLDHFKRVNDSVGHAAGDQLLTIVAQRLRACVKDGDTVARLAGDEFTVILRNVADPEAASLVAERIIESLRLPVSLAGRDHHVQASIGMALFPDDGTTSDDLSRAADGAMYRAKELGRGRAVFFDRRLMQNRFNTTHSGLYRALRRREFSLFYQPLYRVDDGSLVGVEALLRWQSPREGMREPADFIPAAESTGLIVDIGGWVLEAACAQLAVWREQGIAPQRLSINASVQQLKYVDFPRNLRRLLDKYGLPPELIEVEITESVFADEVAGDAMRQLAKTGISMALDDFGTGYSSLNSLRQHPIRVVKIDRSFLEEAPANPASATLVESIITMAHALGKIVVAEGVETAEQLDFLRERGCDLAQGYYLARPMSVTQISELLQAARQGQAPALLQDVG